MNYPRSKIMKLAVIAEGGALVIAILLAGWLDIELFPLTRKPVHDLLIGTAAAIPPFLLFLFFVSKAAENVPFHGSLRKKVLIEIRAIFIIFDLE